MPAGTEVGDAVEGRVKVYPRRQTSSLFSRADRHLEER